MEQAVVGVHQLTQAAMALLLYHPALVMVEVLPAKSAWVELACQARCLSGWEHWSSHLLRPPPHGSSRGQKPRPRLLRRGRRPGQQRQTWCPRQRSRRWQVGRRRWLEKMGNGEPPRADALYKLNAAVWPDQLHTLAPPSWLPELISSWYAC
jgi:hypothetical protein